MSFAAFFILSPTEMAFAETHNYQKGGSYTVYCDDDIELRALFDPSDYSYENACKAFGRVQTKRLSPFDITRRKRLTQAVDNGT